MGTKVDFWKDATIILIIKLPIQPSSAALSWDHLAIFLGASVLLKLGCSSDIHRPYHLSRPNYISIFVRLCHVKFRLLFFAKLEQL